MDKKRAPGAKYWVAGRVEGKVVAFFVDSGADVSIMPARLLPKCTTNPVFEKFNLTDYRDKNPEIVEAEATLTISFQPGVLKARFYVLPNVPHAIIGNDILRNYKDEGVNFRTDREMFEVRGGRLFTKDSPPKARGEYHRRRVLGQNYRRETTQWLTSKAWMRTKERQVLPPKSVSRIPCYIDDYMVDGGLKPGTRTFLSRFHYPHAHDEIIPNESGVMMPSVTFDEPKDVYSLLVENTNDVEYVMEKDCVLGDIVATDFEDFEHQRACYNDVPYQYHHRRSYFHEPYGSRPSDGQSSYQIYAVTDILAEFRRREESSKQKVSATSKETKKQKRQSRRLSKKSCKNSDSLTEESSADEDAVDEPLDESAGAPVKFSSIVDRNRLTLEELADCRERGIEIDVPLRPTAADADVDIIEDVDIEFEKKKADQCPFWEDKQEFLDNFNMKDMDEKLKLQVCDLLWSFRHVFHNPAHPSQFHEGIRCKPIVVDRIEGKTPPRGKYRQISDRKLHYLRHHIKSMCDEQILAELESQYYENVASPVHIVLEERFLASKNQNVLKSRFTADLRELNKCIADVSFPLPNMEEFRREITQEGFKIFSNLDASQFFYQFRLDPDSARKNFGVLALGRVYMFLRLAMGYKNSPSIAQSIISKCLRCHKRAKAFLDDLTTYSKSVDEHLHQDLPKLLAICSHYNILLKPSKADLFRSSLRILGHQISEEALTLSNDKILKLKDLSFPVDKKDLVSKLAFFAYFQRLAPKLSEFLAPLRRLAISKIHFKPTEEHKICFEKAKEHLLDPAVNAIRSPSSSLENDIVLFCDASAQSIACLLCQMLYPLNGDKTKKLHIIGCFSSVIKPQWENFPVWLLELMAFYEATRKFSHLLASRPFWLVTDSQTVRTWTSLENLPRDLSRRVIHLQKFQYRILYCDGRINPSDCLSRMGNLPKVPAGEFPRFLRARIWNSKGEPVPWESLFSQRKADQAKEFFLKQRNQPMSKAVDDYNIDELLEEEEDEIEVLFGSDHALEFAVDANPSSERLQPESVDAVHASIAAFCLTDDDVDDGVIEEGEEGEPDDPMLADVPLPTFADERLEEVKRMQNDDELREIAAYLRGEKETPNKYQATLLPQNVRRFLNHRSLFRLSAQGILFRLWTKANGDVDVLIVVSSSAFDELIAEVHGFNDSGTNILPHVGARRTLQFIGRKYFAFRMREKINRYISSCPSCRLNTHPVGTAEKTGAAFPDEINDVWQCDFLGPLGSFAKTSTGSPQYVFVAICALSSYLYAHVTKSTDDNETVKALLGLRKAICGYPSRVQSDNALFTPRSKSLQLLKENGVEVCHGLAYISRCQTVAERAIGSLTRLLTKFHTESPSTKFETLVEEAVIAHNSSPMDSLPNALAPRDVFFTRSPRSFLRTEAVDEPLRGPRALQEMLQASRATEREIVAHKVQNFLKREKNRSPTNYQRRLRVGDFCLKKRTSFHDSTPVKLSFKIKIDGFEIISRIATNSFRCKSVVDDHVEVLPGDLLVKLRNFDRDSLKTLVESMQRAANLHNAAPARPNTRASSRVDAIRANPVFYISPISRGESIFEGLGECNLFV